MIRSTRWLVFAAGVATISACTLMVPADASAQRRAEPRSARRIVVHHARPYRLVSYPAFYGYGGYSPWRHSWYSPYRWHPYGYWGQPLPPYGRFYAGYSSDARLQVEPREAQVYIDGYFVGIVDDFDGWAQRLRVPPGEHELEIRLDGYRPFREKVLFRPGATLRIQQVLQPLGPGETPEPPPVPAVPRREAPGISPDGEGRQYGAIAVRVQPADAQVIVNGEPWESPETGDLTLQLAEGTHRVEIRKEGFRTYTADVAVRRGETTTLNVSLSR